MQPKGAAAAPGMETGGGKWGVAQGSDEQSPGDHLEEEVGRGKAPLRGAGGQFSWQGKGRLMFPPP